MPCTSITHQASPITHAHTHAHSASSTRTQRVYLHTEDPYPATRSTTSATRRHQKEKSGERGVEEKREIPCTSITLLPRKHHQLHTRARTHTLHHQHARSAFTYNLQIHIEQPAVPPVQPDVTKKKRAERGKRKMQCMSITLLLASSITNYTRAHARTLCTINTHATRLLTC